MTARYGSAVTATLSGILDQLRPAKPIGRLGLEDRLDGEPCLVTGANSGLGRAVAVELARRGGRVVMAGRTLDEQARADIKRRSGSSEVWLEHLDLARLQTVAAFGERMAARRQRFAVVVINAGVVPSESRRTVDDLEESFQVNYLANLLLLDRLLDAGCLERDERAPRIVFVSSEAHRSAKIIDWASLGAFRPYGIKGSVAEYCRVKLLLTTYAVELARRLGPEIGVHSLCPGAVRTRIAREAPWWSQPALQVAMRLFFRSPERAAEPVAFLACSRALEGETGIYLHGMTAKQVSEAAASADNGRRLWDASHRLLEERGFSTAGHWSRPLAEAPVQPLGAAATRR